MSRREHRVLRLGALVVLALAAWLPRSSAHPVGSSADVALAAVHAPGGHANVTIGEPATFTDVRNVSWTAAK